MNTMRLIVSILIGIGLIVIVLILIFRAFASLGTTNRSDVDRSQANLASQADNDSTMRFTTQGRINSEEEHRQIVISVSRSQVQMQVMSGYQNNVIDSATFANNEAAYGNFLRALDLAGFTNGNDSEELRDERGYCPRGQRFVLEAHGEGLDTRFWSTSCSNTTRTSRADVNTVRDLFRAQVPDYSNRVSGVQL